MKILNKSFLIAFFSAAFALTASASLSLSSDLDALCGNDPSISPECERCDSPASDHDCFKKYPGFVCSGERTSCQPVDADERGMICECTLAW